MNELLREWRDWTRTIQLFAHKKLPHRKFALHRTRKYFLQHGKSGESNLAQTATPLGEAQPFEYTEDVAIGNESTTAWLPVEGGPPNTWVENPSGSGQLRFYDSAGNAAIDIDCDHDHGFGNPHWHQWSDGARDRGNPMSTICY